MELNSDGNIDFRSKKTTNQTTSVKKRCSSVGTINISKDEINKIIGTNLNPRPVKTYSDKPVQKTKNSQEDKKAIGQTRTSESFSVDDVNLSQDILFKPRNSVARTPPQTTSTANKQQDSITKGDDNDVFNNESTYSLNMNTQKRSRSNSSPTTSEKNKIKRPNTETCMEVGSALDKHCCSTKNSTENILNEVLDSLQRIQQNIDLMPLDEARKTSSDLFIVHKHVTNLAFRIGQVEKTNLELNNKIKDLLADIKTVPSDPPSNSAPAKSYATVIAQKITTSQPDNQKSTSVWKTPPTSNKLETIIRVSEVTDPKIIKKKLREEFSGKDMEGGFKAVKPLKNGAVIIESHSKAQQEKLKQALQGKSEIIVKDLQKTEPMFMVTGIEKGYDEKEFVEELFRQNPDAQNATTTEDIAKVQVVTRKTCRNPMKENWILRASPKIVKWFLKRGVINFDLQATYVQEYLPLTMCFKCSGFGHVAKYCQKKECCHRCGGEHSAKDCLETALKCPNCCQMGYKEVNHTARDKNCPTYKRKLDRTRLNVNYNIDNPFLV